MDCALSTLHTLIACFSWSNFYVDGGLLYQDSGVEKVTAAYEWYDAKYILQDRDESHYASNPYGRVALGYEMRFTNVSLSLEAAHTSSLDTGSDRGVNAISLKARWYPFR